MIITIDGPSAAGKSTVAQLLAQRLDFGYLDTGAMYRALTWKALDQGIDFSDEERLTALAAKTRIEFRAAGEHGSRVFVDGKDVTADVRSPGVASTVSLVAKIAGVREQMVMRQRAIGKDKVVVEGRDIGSIVFPEADLKIFLTASSAERARRRQIDLGRTGHDVGLDAVRNGLLERDRIDSERRTGPLKVPAEARTIDTTGMAASEVVEAILSIAESSGKLFEM